VLLQSESASASPQRMVLPSMPYAQGDWGVAVAEADPVWHGLGDGVSLALTWQGLGDGVSLPLTWQGDAVAVWLYDGVRVVECEGGRLRVTEAVPVFEACTREAEGIGKWGRGAQSGRSAATGATEMRECCGVRASTHRRVLSL